MRLLVAGVHKKLKYPVMLTAIVFVDGIRHTSADCALSRTRRQCQI